MFSKGTRQKTKQKTQNNYLCFLRLFVQGRKSLIEHAITTEKRLDCDIHRPKKVLGHRAKFININTLPDMQAIMTSICGLLLRNLTR